MFEASFRSFGGEREGEYLKGIFRFLIRRIVTERSLRMFESERIIAYFFYWPVINRLFKNSFSLKILKADINIFLSMFVFKNFYLLKES